MTRRHVERAVQSVTARYVDRSSKREARMTSGLPRRFGRRDLSDGYRDACNARRRRTRAQQDGTVRFVGVDEPIRLISAVSRAAPAARAGEAPQAPRCRMAHRFGYAVDGWTHRRIVRRLTPPVPVGSIPVVGGMIRGEAGV